VLPEISGSERKPFCLARGTCLPEGLDISLQQLLRGIMP